MKSCFKSPAHSRTRKVALLLKARYADFAHHNRRNPFEELLFILCSVQTQESSYRRTFRALRRTFPRMTQLASASVEEIAAPLKSGGLSRSKSRQIKQICVRLNGAFGRPTLAPLAELNDEECESFLTSLPGVGLKVARCVMLYSLGRAVFPVDTHCWRVCLRLGWVRRTRDGVCTRHDMNRLQERIPPAWRFSLHVNLISLGREICRDDKPRCEVCPLSMCCRTAQALQRTSIRSAVQARRRRK